MPSDKEKASTFWWRLLLLLVFFRFEFFQGQLLIACQHLLCQPVRIRMGIDDALNPGIDEDLGADNTGLMRAVQRRAFGGHAVYSRLDDGILFGVDTAAKFVVLTAGDMELLPKASHFLTMGDALWRSIVARGKDLPVLTKTAPTCRRRQVERLATTSAISIK